MKGLQVSSDDMSAAGTHPCRNTMFERDHAHDGKEAWENESPNHPTGCS